MSDGSSEAQPSTAEELVDIVDEHDQVIATVTRREMRVRHLRHRGVAVVVWSSDGRLLVHRRAEDKDIWPGRWDVGFGGVVGAGEAYVEAAVRELAEEAGIIAEPGSLRFIGRGAHVDADVDLVAEVYEITYDGPVRFDDGEVAEARWVIERELHDLLATVELVPDSAAFIVPRLRFAT